MASPISGASARMNGIDVSIPTCRQPVSFFGVLPFTWDVCRRKCRRRLRANEDKRKGLRGSTKNEGGAIAVDRRRVLPPDPQPALCPQDKMKAGRLLPPRHHHTAAPTPRCSPPNRERPAGHLHRNQRAEARDGRTQRLSPARVSKCVREHGARRGAWIQGGGDGR